MSRIRRHLTYANVMVTVLAFIVLGGGAAYATHLVVNSSDVVDDSLRSVDILGKPGSSSAPAVNGTLNTHDISGQAPSPGNGTPFVDGTLTQWDVRNGSLVGADVGDDSLRGADIHDDSLRGRDIDESTLGKVPTASNADAVNGQTAAQLEGARAFAVVRGGESCRDPVTSCPLFHGKRVAYAVRVSNSTYCVGVDGINATDPTSIAMVTPTGGSPDTWARWRAAREGNVLCLGREFEILTGLGQNGVGLDFTIVIP